jgi:Cdc6-like AAA superfamily ATPase
VSKAYWTVYLSIAIAEQPGSSSGQIWEDYIKACNQNGRKTIATRTFAAYLSKLIDLKLVSGEYSRRNIRTFQAI